jgi:hypothetical protein
MEWCTRSARHDGPLLSTGLVGNHKVSSDDAIAAISL